MGINTEFFTGEVELNARIGEICLPSAEMIRVVGNSRWLSRLLLFINLLSFPGFRL